MIRPTLSNMSMRLLRKDKHEGMSESQRLQATLIEAKKLESIKRLETNLPAFQREYNELVKKHGIVHQAQLNANSNGIFPTIVLRECAEQIEQQVRKTEGDGVVKS